MSGSRVIKLAVPSLHIHTVFRPEILPTLLVRLHRQQIIKQIHSFFANITNRKQSSIDTSDSVFLTETVEVSHQSFLDDNTHHFARALFKNHQVS